MCASAVPGKTGKHENRIFFTALPQFNQSLLALFSIFDSRLILTLFYDSLNLIARAVGGHGLRERKSREPQQLDCVACTMHVHQCTVFLKEKNVICDVFDSV